MHLNVTLPGMETIVIRVSRPRMDQLIAGIGAAMRAAPGPAEAAALQETWSWLVHRYTMAWGLPPQLGQAGGGGGPLPGLADNGGHDRLA